MTLNWFRVARCTRTFLPLGAPAMSSTAHWPSTIVHPSMPLLSKSNFSVGTLSGTLSSSAAMAAGRWDPPAPARTAASVTPKRRRRVTFMRRSPRVSSVAAAQLPSHRGSSRLVELFRDGLPLRALDERHVGDGMAIFELRHDADRAVSLVLLDRFRCRCIERPVGLGHGLGLGLGMGQIVAL